MSFDAAREKTEAMQQLLAQAIEGDADAYAEFQATYRVLPLEEAENLLAHFAGLVIDISEKPPVLAQLLVDMGAFADRASQYHGKQESLENARGYAEQACSYWEQAIAVYASAEAHYQLGRWYLRDWPVYEANVSEGLRHIGIAADDYQHGDALYYLGDVYHLGKYPGEAKNPAKAVRYWEVAVRHAQHAKAAYRLAKLYETGYENVIAAEPSKAFALLTQAASFCHPQAAFSLWVLYNEGATEEGLTVVKNPQRATLWLQHAARWGDAMAQYLLGKAYLAEGETAEAKQQALALLQASAQQGHEDAKQLLKDERVAATAVHAVQ